MTFASSFAAGLQLAEQQRLHADDKAIEAAGKKVAERNAEIERQKKAEQDLINNATAKSTKQSTEEPGIYQQGDSLGLRGYQTGNKPVQATVQTAPAGYMSRPGEEVTPGFDTGGYYEPDPNTSANPSTEQTLVGNYGTTAAFKGEKPTEQDILRMQQEPTQEYSYAIADDKNNTTVTTVPGSSGPFTGEDKQITNITELAASKPATPAEEVKPKPLETLNDSVTAADLAQKSYQYHMEVLNELEKGGNAKAALAYRDKVAGTELTMAQAQQVKFNTSASISKQVANIAANTLEAIQQPGADVNKLYSDFIDRARREFGFTGKIPFSLDPRENIKTLDRLQKDAMTVTEKSELNLKAANAQIEKNIQLNKLAIDQDKLTLDKIRAQLEIGKFNRDEAQAVFNRLVERSKLLQNGINAINEYQDDDTKKAYKAEMDTTISQLKTFEKDLGLKSPINLNTFSMGIPPSSTKVGNAASAATATQSNNPAPATTQTKPNESTIGTYTVDLNKPSNSTAGGYEGVTSTTKEPSKKDTPRIKFLKSKIQELTSKTRSPASAVAISNPFADVVNLGGRVVSSVTESDLLNPTKAGQKERERQAKELKKYQDELDALTK